MKNGPDTLCEIARETFELVESPDSTLLILPYLCSTKQGQFLRWHNTVERLHHCVYERSETLTRVEAWRLPCHRCSPLPVLLGLRGLVDTFLQIRRAAIKAKIPAANTGFSKRDGR